MLFRSTLNITGGAGAGLLHQPQVAIYRAGTFGCPAQAGDEDLFCARAGVNGNSVTVDLRGLDPLQDYYIRVNDYSATATPNSGNFTLCLSTFVAVTLLDHDQTVTACAGTLLDSGGHGGNYGSADDYTITISPPGSGCLSLTLDSLNLAGSATFIIYNGPNTTSPVLATLGAGNNSNNPRQYVASSRNSVRLARIHRLGSY